MGIDAEIIKDKEWEDDGIHFCACGEEKNPSFPKCFMCSKQDREDFEEWIIGWRRRIVGFEQEPF